MLTTTALGVDLGGTKLLACLADGRGRVLHRLRRPTGRRTAPARAIELITDVAGEMRDAGLQIAAVGVGFPGLVDVERGLVHSSVMLDGWHDVPLARRIAARVGVPCRVDNDVNTAAIAEAHVRGGARAMVFVAVGTGIGGALVLDGRLWRGASGVAGEIGNMTIARDGRRCRCGRRGCLNTVASGSAIERALGLRPNALARGAGSRARVRRAARIAAEALGVGLGNVMNLLNPSLVVIGGGVAFLGAGFLETLRRRARAEAFSEATRACRLERTRAGYEAGAIGAALLALSYLDGCPR